jgi:hypothetical protein
MSNREEKVMLIVLDYDETYTAAPVLWDQFIQLAKSYGHEIVCCTYRLEFPESDNADVIADMTQHGVQIVYAGKFNRKFEAMYDAGFNPQNAIWIDDCPSFIC